MGYIPDWRHETDKLNEPHKAYVDGYRHAYEVLKNAFLGLDYDEMLTVEKEVIANLQATLEEYMDVSEIELVCALFSEAEYEDIELEDKHI